MIVLVMIAARLPTPVFAQDVDQTAELAKKHFSLHLAIATRQLSSKFGNHKI
jgi:hypothetical protein